MINFDRLNNKICLDLSHTFCMTSINVSICSQYLLIFHQHWHSFTCRRPTVLWSFSLQNTNFSRTLTTLNTACTSLFEHLIWSSSLQNCLSVVPTFVISQLTRDFFSLSDLEISKDTANLISKVENTNQEKAAAYHFLRLNCFCMLLRWLLAIFCLFNGSVEELLETVTDHEIHIFSFSWSIIVGGL